LDVGPGRLLELVESGQKVFGGHHVVLTEDGAKSASSRMPRLGVLSLESATSATAATRASSDHSPPAMSATVRSGSQMSASRSSMPSGMSGQELLAELESIAEPC
jgi:hypothetical protein